MCVINIQSGRGFLSIDWKHVQCVWKGITANSLCTLLLFLFCLLLYALLLLNYMSLYCFHIRLYYISLWLLSRFILPLLLCCFILVNSFYFLLNWYSFLNDYLYYERELNHTKNEAYSMKTNTSCPNLVPHYNARWQGCSLRVLVKLGKQTRAGVIRVFFFNFFCLNTLLIKLKFLNEWCLL